MTNLYELIKGYASKALVTFQGLIGYIPNHPRNTILCVRDRTLSSEVNEETFADEFSIQMSRLEHEAKLETRVSGQLRPGYIPCKK